MPTYEYQCTSCRHRFEEFQRITDAPLSRCPRCGKPVKRLIGGGMGIIFKGSGFYSTDHRKSAIATGGNGSSSKAAGTKPESGSKESGSKPESSKD